MKSVSRRSVLRSAVSAPVVVACSPGLNGSSSCYLEQLGMRFDELAKQMDEAIDARKEFGDEVLIQFGRIEAEIINTPATTIDGLRVKARAACWALMGDLDSGDGSTTDKRMALSIVRDLIRLYDPELERPGAVKELLAEIEAGAGAGRATERT